jgi:hypothetical protein
MCFVQDRRNRSIFGEQATVGEQMHCVRSMDDDDYGHISPSTLIGLNSRQRRTKRALLRKTLPAMLRSMARSSPFGCCCVGLTGSGRSG